MKRDTMVSTTAREILRRARRQQGLTQKELAERAGVSQNVVARYEASRQQPTIAALERLMAACGCELVWSVRHATASSAAVGMPDAALMVNAADAGAGARFPGPIGRRLTAQRDEVLNLLAAAGATEPRVHGGVANGTEPVDCHVLIGVTTPPGSDRVPLIAASGHIGLLLEAPVHVLRHADVAAYGYGDDGIRLDV